MKIAGWLDACEDGLPDVGFLDPVRPEVNQPSKAWRLLYWQKTSSNRGKE